LLENVLDQQGAHQQKTIRNVNVRSGPVATIPCALCGEKLKKKTDKNGKPYFICDPCGMQLFIRHKQGINNLGELIHSLKVHEYHFREHSHVLCEIRAVLKEMRGVKEEIRSLEDGLALFESNSDRKGRKRAVKLLNNRIDNLVSELAQLSHARARI
jgi:hypothetical protein